MPKKKPPPEPTDAELLAEATEKLNQPYAGHWPPIPPPPAR